MKPKANDQAGSAALPAVLLAALLILLAVLPASAQKIREDTTDPAYTAFFTKPQKKGMVRIAMYPNPRILGKLQVVGFGAPFPPGFVTDPKDIWLTDDRGNEFALSVTVLARWPEPMPGAGSIRSVLIQYRDLMSTAQPRTYVLGWGQPRRLHERRSWPARTGWLDVDDGSYPKGKVYDPPVYVTFPAAWLGKCLLKGRIMPSGRVPRLFFYDQALVASADAATNRFDAKVKKKYHIDYLNSFEPWLYDRAAAYYVTYIRTGEVRFLRDAHRAAQYFADNVDRSGRFALLPKNRGTSLKYAAHEGLAMDYWLFGDRRMLGVSRRLVGQLDSWDPEYRHKRGFWTERHLGLSLLTAVTAYELTGDPAMLKRARKIFDAGHRMQTAPPAGAPRDGCFIHTGKQHGISAPGWYCSPWMSALVVDAMLRYYIVTADPLVRQSILLVADFVAKHGTYRIKLSKNRPWIFTFPHYLVSSTHRIKSEMNPWNDREHAMDVAKILAAALYFKGKRSEVDPEHERVFFELLDLARWNFEKKRPANHWKRGLPKAVISPPRKFNWWFRITADIDWLISHKK